mgnify:CR=1 FL=1
MSKFTNQEPVQITRGKYKGNRAKYIERVMDYGYMTPYATVKIYVDEEDIYIGDVLLRNLKSI